jgi:hypothetical protein
LGAYGLLSAAAEDGDAVAEEGGEPDEPGGVSAARLDVAAGAGAAALSAAPLADTAGAADAYGTVVTLLTVGDAGVDAMDLGASEDVL